MKKFILSFVFLSIAVLCYSQHEFQLRNEVHKYLAQSNSNFNFVMLAEAYRNETGVAFFWPCLMDSVVVDDKIIAVAFEKQNNEWISVDMFISSKDTNMSKFLRVIGGSDYKIFKPDGIPLENMGNFMFDKITVSHKSIIKKENEKAVAEIEEFSRAFSLRTCAFSNVMAGYIMRGAKILDISEIKISNIKTSENTGTATLDVYYPGIAKSNTAKLVKIGTGWAIDSVE